jgi:hypothetical protein
VHTLLRVHAENQPERHLITVCQLHYSAYSLSEAFGVDSHKVGLWIRRKMLHATRRGTDRTQGGDSYWITHDAAREFVYRHPDEIDLARVEKLWFLDLVSVGRIGAY